MPAIVEFVDIAGLVAGASKGEGLGNQFLAHIRETDAHRQRGALLRRRQRDPRGRQGRPGLRHRGDPDRAGLADLATVEKALQRDSKTGQVRRQGSGQARGACWKGAGRTSTRASRCAASAWSKEEQHAAQAAVPDHRQAGDVRRQRRRERLREQPAPRPPAASTPRRRGRAGGGDLRQDGSRDRRHARTRTSRCSWPTWAWTSRA